MTCPPQQGLGSHQLWIEILGIDARAVQGAPPGKHASCGAGTEMWRPLLGTAGVLHGGRSVAGKAGSGASCGDGFSACSLLGC